jgi:putative hemolysin
MKLLRLLLVFLLALAMPLAASSAAVMEITMSHCPLQDKTGMSAPAEHDCCDTGKSTTSNPESSNPCKPGQACKICSVPYLSVSFFAAVPSLPPAGQLFVAHPNTFISSHDPAGLWRPPRFL